MPEWSVQRRFIRYTIVLPILHTMNGSAPARTGVGWTSNLSQGGACLELAERLKPSAPLSLLLRTDEGDIELNAEVVWAAEPTAAEGGILHSVVFTQVTPDRQQALRELLRHKGHVRHSGIRLPIELSILCRGKDEAAPLLQGRTGDISRAGLLLRLPQALPVGTVLEVTVQTGHGPLAAEGAIIWVEPAQAGTPGGLICHGFRFTNMGWASELALGHLLAGRL